MKKIKCWVVYSDNYPGGMVYNNRNDALEDAAETRSAGNDAYVRVKYFTKERRSVAGGIGREMYKARHFPQCDVASESQANQTGLARQTQYGRKQGNGGTRGPSAALPAPR